MLKRTLFMALVLASVVLGYVAFVAFAPTAWKHRSDIELSERLIAMVEDFRHTQGRLPSEQEAFSFREKLGLPADDTCPCYTVKEGDQYIVWFGTTLGSSYVYNSSTSEWNDAG